MRGEPVISFAAHEDRAGVGADGDFENMLALLISAIEGDAHGIQPNPGDWGIDVVVGDLSGAVRIWQAKYFRNGATKNQQKQIRNSFASAIRAAIEHGHRIQEWVLCISSSMDAPTKKWWDAWKLHQERETGVSISLWDETKLRQLLLRPEAAHVRRAFYDRYREPEDYDEAPREPPSPVAPIATATDSNRIWSGGDVVRIGLHEYLLHDTPQQTRSQDGSQLWQDATADRLATGQPVRLRQAIAVRPVSTWGGDHRQTLAKQSRLLAELRGQAMLPVLVDLVENDRSTTLVIGQSAGRLWHQAFGPGPVPLDRLTASGALAAAADVGAALGRLHRQGQQHRNLSPWSVVISSTGRGKLWDLGQACIPASTRDGHPAYRAPEQARAPYLAGPATDLFQLAALVHHTLTGHPVAPLPPPPVRLSLPEFPAAVDTLLHQMLDSDPRQRPDLDTVITALRAGTRALSRLTSG